MLNCVSSIFEFLKTVPLAIVQAAVGEAISRIDAATKTIEREYRVREEQRELLQTLKNEKSLIKEASQNQKLLEQGTLKYLK